MKQLVLGLLMLLTSPAWAGEGANHVEIFLGATTTHKVSYGTIGLEYERRLNNQFGVGVLLETVQTNPSETIVAALGYYHFNNPTKVFLGLGQESVSGHSESFVRYGIAYDFHVGKIYLTPAYCYDTIGSSGSANVFGLGIGVGF